MIVSHQSSMTSLILVALIGCCLVASAIAVGGEIRLGAAVVKITPPLGTPLAGYYSVRGSEGVLDDICARAVVLDDGKTQAAMVTCDLIGLSRSVVLEARRIITEKTGIPALNVMISATHTHTAPVVIGDSALDDFTSGGSILSKDYAGNCPSGSRRRSRKRTHSACQPASSYGSENETKLSYIRRFWMKDGTVGWNPGVLNPNIIRPVGDIDPQVNVVYAETAGQQPGGAVEKLEADGSRKPVNTDTAPLLTYVNFALHLDTTGGTLISAWRCLRGHGQAPLGQTNHRRQWPRDDRGHRPPLPWFRVLVGGGPRPVQRPGRTDLRSEAAVLQLRRVVGRPSAAEPARPQSDQQMELGNAAARRPS